MKTAYNIIMQIIKTSMPNINKFKNLHDHVINPLKNIINNNAKFISQHIDIKNIDDFIDIGNSIYSFPTGFYHDNHLFIYKLRYQYRITDYNSTLKNIMSIDNPALTAYINNYMVMDNIFIDIKENPKFIDENNDFFILKYFMPDEASLLSISDILNYEHDNAILPLDIDYSDIIKDLFYVKMAYVKQIVRPNNITFGNDKSIVNLFYGNKNEMNEHALYMNAIHNMRSLNREINIIHIDDFKRLHNDNQH